MRSANTIPGARLLFAVCLLILFASNVAGQRRDEQIPQNLAFFSQKDFIENKGQMVDMDGKPVPFVLFKKETPGLDLYLTETGLTYVFLNWRKEPKIPLSEPEKQDEQRTGKKKMRKVLDWSRIDIILKGASIKKENIVSENGSEDHSQYFLAHCPEGIKGIRSYEKITIKNVYPGIDWVFYNSTEKGVKYDFVVHPDADPAHIKLLYRSKEKLNLDDQGNLQIQTPYGILTENSPVSYIEDSKENVPTKFVKTKEPQNEQGFETEVGFSLELPTPNSQLQTLIIDPQLYWATFYGGSGFDGPRAAETDNAGNLYVAGYTESANFPTLTSGTFFQGTFAGGTRDAFIIKFDNSGVRLWSTYYGGTQVDEIWQLAIDNANNLFAFGYTESANFPTQNAGTFFQGTYAGQGDALILKFDGAGNRLWATYYGGINMEEGFGIASDPNGNVFMTGETRSPTTFPLQNAGTFYQGAYGTGTSDAFILKFDNAGNRLWATYAGGWNTDMGNAITTDAAGNVFVTGYAWGGGFPVLNAGTFFQGTITGSGDVFIMKFNNAGTLLWSTYYGGGAVDEGNSIVTDAAGNVFITGVTASSSFPTQNAGTYFDGTKGGTWDTYMLKFDNAGNRLWATFFGGSSDEAYWQYSYDNLAVDDCGNVYMSAETQSTDVTVQPACDGGFYNGTFNGGTYDIILTQFSNTGVMQWSTYLGGSGDDFRSPLAVDDSNNLFVSGEWTDGTPIVVSTYPVTNPGGGAYNGTFAGGHDGFLSKFEKTPPTLTVTPVNAGCGCTGTATANASGICSPFTYLWSNSQTTQTATGLCAGNYTVSVFNSMCGTVTNTVTITSTGGFSVTATSGPATCLASNGSATVTPTGGQTPYTYSWSPTGGSSSTATGLSAGNYTVLITDALGCTNTTTVAVAQPAAVTSTISSTPATCGNNNGTASVVASGGTSPYSYSWSSGGTTSQISNLSSQIYSVTITDANGCTGTNTVSVPASGSVTAAISSPTTICFGLNVTMNASGGTNYSWSTGATSSSIVVTPLVPTTYSVIVSSGSCSDTASVTIQILQILNPPIIGNTTICAGQSTTLSTAGGPPTTFLWSTGNTTTSIVVTPTTNTGYTITITDVNGCTAYSSQTVVLTPPPVASATGETICQGEIAFLSASGGNTYSWSNGGTGNGINVSPSSTTVYTVTVSIGTCTAAATATVVVNPLPVANAGASVTINAGSSTTLNATGGGLYLWTPSSGLSCTTCSNPSASPGVTTTYTVVVTDLNGCTAADVVTVFVIPDADPCAGIGIDNAFYLPNAFSPNNDTENDELCILGREDCIQEFTIHIFNRWGEEVFTSDLKTFCWNGTHKNKQLDTAVFAYYLKAVLTSGDVVERHGNITLAR